jgi:hypothetical protein
MNYNNIISLHLTKFNSVSDLEKVLLKSIEYNREVGELSIDIILDKISSKGLNSLNRYEKSFLENNSK